MKLNDIDQLSKLKREWDALTNDLDNLKKAGLYSSSTFTAIQFRYGSSSGDANMSEFGRQAMWMGASNVLEKRRDFIKAQLAMVGVTDFGEK